MLPSNYDSLAAKHPELRSVLRRVAEWVRAHVDWDLIDPRILSKDLRDVDPVKLATALEALIDEGTLQQAYMVVTPDTGVLAEGQYQHLDEIPKRVYDRSRRSVDTAEAEIVAVLTRPK